MPSTATYRSGVKKELNQSYLHTWGQKLMSRSWEANCGPEPNSTGGVLWCGVPN